MGLGPLVFWLGLWSLGLGLESGSWVLVLGFGLGF